MLEHRLAELSDSPLICALVNAAYRGETSRAGWTTEADLLTGVRTSERTIQALIEREDACILLGEEAGVVVACICIERGHAAANTVYLGMIAVSPLLQNRGYGKAMIMAAEKLAIARWQVQHAEMTVISLRQELIAFYQRLGYLPTGVLKPFPVAPDLWQPQVSDMQLQVLCKHLVMA